MKENGKYRLLQSAYYAGQSLTLSYAAYYLGTAGFSDRTIGIIMAVTCALGSVFQGVVGRLADQSRIFHWKRQLQIYSIGNGSFRFIPSLKFYFPYCCL